mmetsp:Transcript_4059/g.15030  ORF Transcript_4059/g.15030 Transcript_4059/m.15030 type:complete len:209 (+) Transcript_4059:320-946(+)
MLLGGKGGRERGDKEEEGVGRAKGGRGRTISRDLFLNLICLRARAGNQALTAALLSLVLIVIIIVINILVLVSLLLALGGRLNSGVRIRLGLCLLLLLGGVLRLLLLRLCHLRILSNFCCRLLQFLGVRYSSSILSFHSGRFLFLVRLHAGLRLRLFLFILVSFIDLEASLIRVLARMISSCFCLGFLALRLLPLLLGALLAALSLVR